MEIDLKLISNMWGFWGLHVRLGSCINLRFTCLVSIVYQLQDLLVLCCVVLLLLMGEECGVLCGRIKMLLWYHGCEWGVDMVVACGGFGIAFAFNMIWGNCFDEVTC